jgi:flagellar biosynthesis/type III secretory pathway M-ring protein FliF/YscJ
MLTLDHPDRFTPDQVSAIKNIVAYSAQQVKPEDVTVVNAATGVELLGLEEAPADVFDDQTRMNYRNMIKNQYEENARRILTPIYGEGEVIAVANVDIDYDKINEEVKEYLTDEENEGVKSNQYIHYDTDGVVDPGGIVGEEPNTDIPNYGNLEDDLNSDNTPEYERKTEWAIGYILRQTEKAQGGITGASISVVVTTETGQLTAAEEENIIQLVRNATNIDVENISASARLADTIVPEEVPGIVDPDSPLAKLMNTPWFKWALLGAAVLLILIITMIIVSVNKRAKKRIALAEAESLAQIESMKKANEQETENLKKTLEQAAKEHSEASNATANEVKEFAKKNPEIAAALIRSMMKG